MLGVLFFYVFVFITVFIFVYLRGTYTDYKTKLTNCSIKERSIKFQNVGVGKNF